MTQPYWLLQLSQIYRWRNSRAVKTNDLSTPKIGSWDLIGRWSRMCLTSMFLPLPELVFKGWYLSTSYFRKQRHLHRWWSAKYGTSKGYSEEVVVIFRGEKRDKWRNHLCAPTGLPWEGLLDLHGSPSVQLTVFSFVSDDFRPRLQRENWTSPPMTPLLSGTRKWAEFSS